MTAAQLRDVVDRLINAGHWREADPDILIVADAGYDVTRLAFVLADLPVQLLGRIRADRVLRLPKPPRAPGTNGRPPKHGPEFALDKPDTWPEPQHHTSQLVGHQVGAAPRQTSAPVSPEQVGTRREVSAMVGDDELHERRGPSQRAVDAGLVRCRYRLQQQVVARADDHVLHPGFFAVRRIHATAVWVSSAARSIPAVSIRPT